MNASFAWTKLGLAILCLTSLISLILLVYASDFNASHSKQFGKALQTTCRAYSTDKQDHW